MMTAAIPSAYAAGLPSSGWREPTSKPSGKGRLLSLGRADQRPTQPQDTAQDVKLPRTGGYVPPFWTAALAAGIGAAFAVGGLGLLVRGRRLSRRGTNFGFLKLTRRGS